MNLIRTIAAITAAALGLLTGNTASAQLRAPTQLAPINYADPTAWLCLPGRFDACSVDLSATSVATSGRARLEEFRLPSREPEIDCFYVYPTVSRDASVYSDMIPDAEERQAIAAEFARFSSVCRTFAPLYRQITLTALNAASNDPGGLDALRSQQPPARGGGYEDVRAAFRAYASNNNQGRGFVLIGRDQGAALLTRLIAEEIEGTSLAPYLISAILPGTSIQVPIGGVVGGTLRSTPLCARDNQTGCVITYASYRDTLPPGPDALFGRASGGLTAACTNPANLRTGKGEADSYFFTLTQPGNLTGPAPNWTGDPWAPVGTPFVQTPGLVETECVSNSYGTYLSVHIDANARDARTDDINGDVLKNGRPDPTWGLHLLDINLMEGNLIDLVARQARGWRPPR